jgi:Tripartite tricarboxylate transporter TctB family
MSERSDMAGPALLPRVVGVRRGGMAMACGLLCVGLLFVWQASLLDFGGLGLPGPGFFPLLLGAILGAFSAVIGLQCWRESAEGTEATDATEGKTVELGHHDVLVVFVALLAVPSLFDWLGAYVTLGLFGAALLVIVARTSFWLACAAAFIAMAACWFFFQLLLGLQLPTGVL